MNEPRTNTVKPLIGNALVRGHLLALSERLAASDNEHCQHVVEAICVVLGAREGVDL